jgi:hypothetical protein
MHARVSTANAWAYYEKESIDTGNIAILQVHLPQLIRTRYLGSFGQSARMLRFLHFPLGKQHIQFVAQSVYLFMVDVQLRKQRKEESQVNWPCETQRWKSSEHNPPKTYPINLRLNT